MAPLLTTLLNYQEHSEDMDMAEHLVFLHHDVSVRKDHRPFLVMTLVLYHYKCV